MDSSKREHKEAVVNKLFTKLICLITRNNKSELSSYLAKLISKKLKNIHYKKHQFNQL